MDYRCLECAGIGRLSAHLSLLCLGFYFSVQLPNVWTWPTALTVTSNTFFFPCVFYLNSRGCIRFRVDFMVVVYVFFCFFINFLTR